MDELTNQLIELGTKYLRLKSKYHLAIDQLERNQIILMSLRTHASPELREMLDVEIADGIELIMDSNI